MPGPALSAIIDPTRGAKITSLKDPRGVEWLTQAAATAKPGTPFIDAEMAGWDECAPTIVSCRVNGCDLPDHGDLWDSSFAVDKDTSTVSAIGHSLGYEFRRRVTATRTGLYLEYQVTALDRPVPFLYAAHPQFLAQPGTHVDVPRLRHVVDVLDPTLPRHEWSAPLATIDTVAPGGYRKLYADPDKPTYSARLIHPDGASLEMNWSMACPYLGIWFDNSAYSREPVIAIEPATGYFDALDTAVAHGRAPQLQRGKPLSWWIKLTITTANASRGV
ncbi:galactose mutarotase-like enzyme [Microbacterium sp. AK009]|uniref:hypothetical protein n=1 Tax=Microbacterium sp. AK009 TaxID=2723068 RepID=UPI0015C73DE7|nr:hypothetical protein [Microbacterium sp. AK009]NYF16553.1 galactose mutarotase-like enzyme [Microbacterium sp. AK009]